MKREFDQWTVNYFGKYQVGLKVASAFNDILFKYGIGEQEKAELNALLPHLRTSRYPEIVHYLNTKLERVIAWSRIFDCSAASGAYEKKNAIGERACFIPGFFRALTNQYFEPKLYREMRIINPSEDDPFNRGFKGEELGVTVTVIALEEKNRVTQHSFARHHVTVERLVSKSSITVEDVLAEDLKARPLTEDEFIDQQLSPDCHEVLRREKLR